VQQHFVQSSIPDGYTLIPNPGRGNCGEYSLGDCASLEGLSLKDIRKHCCEYIQNHAVSFTELCSSFYVVKPFLSKDKGLLPGRDVCTSVKQWLEYQSPDRIFFEMPMMIAASVIYHRSIVLYVEHNGEKFKHEIMPLRRDAGSPVWYLKLTGNHWEAMNPALLNVQPIVVSEYF